ncbi:MAG: PH domain-containing protein [Janthinobacterium sp.]|jgi:hypothetical protein
MAKIDKLANSAKAHLEPDESVLSVVMGAYETKLMNRDTVINGVFIATEKRLVFYGSKLFGYNMEVFPYSNISSIEISKGMMGHAIAFFASGNKVGMKWITKGDVEGFARLVKSKIGKKTETPMQNQPDIADQIRKLAQLKNDGILTEDEFSIKKAQLLS